MPDMQDAIKKAGLSTHSSGRGTTSHSKGSFPEGYPSYFDADGILKCEYLTELAQQIAERFGNESLTMHQLRAFYGHVKRQQASLKNGRPFKEVYPEICKLKPFARDRAEKRKIPRYFEDFVSRNVDKAKDEKTFLEGFVEHFQAVVAYCAGTIQQR